MPSLSNFFLVLQFWNFFWYFISLKLFGNKKLLTRAKGSISLGRNILIILSLKQFKNLNGRNGMQKKRMQNKIIQILIKLTWNVMQNKKVQNKPILNDKISLDVSCYCQENQEKYDLLNVTIDPIIFPWMGWLFKIKCNASFRKTCFFFKKTRVWAHT